MNLFSLMLTKNDPSLLCDFFSQVVFLSLLAHRFGGIENRKFVVVSAGTVEKIKTNILYKERFSNKQESKLFIKFAYVL